MAAPPLVLIDTCIWASFFNRPQSPEKRAVDRLLDDDRAALIGPVLAEVLLGFRRHEQADWVASLLHGLRFLEVSWNEWRVAARLGRQCRESGRTLPLSDLVIAAVALERGIQVYSTDPDFEAFDDLTRFTP